MMDTPILWSRLSRNGLPIEEKKSAYSDQAGAAPPWLPLLPLRFPGRGERFRRRQPENVIREIEGYHKRWGARRFWFTDAQLLADPRGR